MRVAPWKVMAGLTVALVIVGIAASLGGLGPVQLLLGAIVLALLVGGLYFGWRIGQRWAE